MKYIEDPRSLHDFDVHLRNFHATLVYDAYDYNLEHALQHQRADRGTLGEHAEFWTPHTHVVTQDTYREEWSTAYWRARDAGDHGGLAVEGDVGGVHDESLALADGEH